MNLETVFLAISLVLYAAALFIFVRNLYVYSVRTAFIWQRPCLEAYDRLPSYDEMLLSPKHWLRWKKSHWDKWLEAA